MSLKTLHAQAIAARENSHSPYSQYKVGAAVQISSGEIFSGCNIENASYGGTVCAERVAIWKAVSEKKNVILQDIAVVIDQPEAWPPCGMCRQVIAEFSCPDTMIHIGNLQGIQRSLKFSELFPESFNPSHLQK
jgi:cytidine deaminase